MFSLEQGKKIVQTARKVVVSEFEKKPFKLEGFEEPSGVFVTIHDYPSNNLRGCIGFIEPIYKLKDALARAAKAAAFSDPRFRPLKEEELERIIFEVSILTKPELIKVNNAEDYKKKIEIGKDGLIAEKGIFSGLLLPQVAKEWEWSIEEFLKNTCEKAGLKPEEWTDLKSVRIYKFQTQVFKEIKPNGEIIEEKP